MIHHAPMDLEARVQSSAWPERMLENIRATLLGIRTVEAAQVGPLSSLEEERALIGTVSKLLETYELGIDALNSTYNEPLVHIKDFTAENRTRIAQARFGFSLTRFVPIEEGYVLETQTSRIPIGTNVSYYATPQRISRSQYAPARVDVEWISENAANDYSIKRRQDQLFKNQFKRIKAAVRQAI